MPAFRKNPRRAAGRGRDYIKIANPIFCIKFALDDLFVEFDSRRNIFEESRLHSRMFAYTQCGKSPDVFRMMRRIKLQIGYTVSRERVDRPNPETTFEESELHSPMFAHTRTRYTTSIRLLKCFPRCTRRIKSQVESRNSVAEL